MQTAHDTTPSATRSAWIPNLLQQVSQSFEIAEPESILDWATDTFGQGLSIGTAFGASGMALVDMAVKRCPQGLDIFYIDTGLFFPETYDLIERAQAHWGVTFRRVTPEASVEAQAQTHGPQLWERDADRCCRMRKVVPLSEALAGRVAWVTALRRDQSHTRRHTPIVHWNERHQVVKLSPLANWTERDLWAYILEHDVPYNPMHDRGFPSIGCAPCTSAVGPGQELRAGRWSGSAKTECGLHL